MPLKMSFSCICPISQGFTSKMSIVFLSILHNLTNYDRIFLVLPKMAGG